jgi:hypothetical protein
LPCFVEDNKITFPDCRESFANLEAQQSRASPPETSAYRRFAEKGQEVVIMVFAQLDSSFWLLAASGGIYRKKLHKAPRIYQAKLGTVHCFAGGYGLAALRQKHAFMRLVNNSKQQCFHRLLPKILIS